MVYDTEIIGTKRPVFLIGVKNIKSGQKWGYWLHETAHLNSFERMWKNPGYTWVSFNGDNFDRPLIAAALEGYDALAIKMIANKIILERLNSWTTYKHFGLDFKRVDVDHIDLFNVAPGPMISLKQYAGRMGFPTMQDMPIHHDHDCNPKERLIIKDYCVNDLGVTEWLYNQLSVENELRVELSAQYGIDLRSKSDAQIAEAILKHTVGITKGTRGIIPEKVEYKAPKFIKTRHLGLVEVMTMLENHEFGINSGNGSPEVPAFLREPLRINDGYYQMGVGGLHSTHDKQLYLEASEGCELSDFDVASYYPNIMLKAGLTPKLDWGKGELFIDEYRKIYEARMAAKDAGNKKVANSLKITLNGTFGKLGNLYCSFYSPELMLGVTITGQLNLLCLIVELEKIKGVKVQSANTDGILLSFHPALRERVETVIAGNAHRTGFIYEETKYKKVAMKDVNNYIAIKTDNTAKRKGLYAVAGVQEMKNPTMEVCSNMAVDYLVEGIHPSEAIKRYKKIEDFVATRGVSGGGVQHERTVLVDDWTEVDYGQWMREVWLRDQTCNRAPVKRKSRPHPVEIGIGGTSFGRVARWYMTTEKKQPITSMTGEVPGVSNGSQVAKTEGAQLCMTLPKGLPKDLDKQWYINETLSILSDLGVSL